MKIALILTNFVFLVFTGTLSAEGSLRHRLYFHPGDSHLANVAETYCEYAVDRETTLTRMRDLVRERKWKELIEQFEKDEFANWPAELAAQTAEAYHLRGQAYMFLKNGKLAEADLKAALKFAPRNELMWLSLADNYANNLNDDEQALAGYRHVWKLTGKSNGWLPIHSTLSIARILTDQVKTDEALEVLKQFGDMKGMAPVWRIKMLRMYGHIYAAQGKEQESLAKFREALELEAKK